METVNKLSDIASRIDHLESVAEWNRAGICAPR
jgi:hypothetical protein